MAKMQLIECMGQNMLFSNGRLHGEDVPEGLFLYHLRESYETEYPFIALEVQAVVNHGGSVVCKEPVIFGSDGCVLFTEETYPNFYGEEMTMEEFLKMEE